MLFLARLILGVAIPSVMSTVSIWTFQMKLPQKNIVAARDDNHVHSATRHVH